jgi:hypothetical protein
MRSGSASGVTKSSGRRFADVIAFDTKYAVTSLADFNALVLAAGRAAVSIDNVASASRSGTANPNPILRVLYNIANFNAALYMNITH